MTETFPDPELAKKAYPMILQEAIKIGRKHNYAIAVHGSKLRDLDIIAVPWTDEATECEEFVTALKNGLTGCLYRDEATEKCHGRKAYILVFHHHLYIDLSVMPKRGD